MNAIIAKLPIRWQVRYWAWRNRNGSKIEAIRGLRQTARLPLKESKTALDPYFDKSERQPQRCPRCDK